MELNKINNINQEVKIVNPRQAGVYIANGIQPLRLELGYNDRIVFIFNRDATREVYKRWCAHEFENNSTM